MGFLEAFSPLYGYDRWRTSFLDGSLPVSRFFSEQILSLVKAKQANDRFAVTRIIKASSPRLAPAVLRQSSDTRRHLDEVIVSIETLMNLWENGADPTLLQVLQCVAKNDLFEIPDPLKAHASGAIERAAVESSENDEKEDPQTERDLAIQNFLMAPFFQIEPMAAYLSGKARFDTHQGVKGLEFDRVMVIMDDAEARGFTFKYEDLFGGKGAGDKTVESTRRLFYVTASRARESLALVAYSSSPARVKRFVIEEEWFSEDEVIDNVLA